MSRLEQSLALLTTNHANIEGARSRLMDVDIATESTHFAKHNILVQSSAAMLAQGVRNRPECRTATARLIGRKDVAPNNNKTKHKEVTCHLS